MDAKELTIRYNQLSEDYKNTKKTVEYLEQEVSKLRMLVDDMNWEIKNITKK